MPSMQNNTDGIRRAVGRRLMYGISWLCDVMLFRAVGLPIAPPAVVSVVIRIFCTASAQHTALVFSRYVNDLITLHYT